MTHEIIIAGFGGQGVLLAGKLLSYAAILDGKETTWISSYGVEMRGGTANCSIVISPQKIGSPFITEPTALIVLNPPSFTKFEPTVVPGGVMITNSSLVEQVSHRNDITELRIPCSDMAIDLGNARAANLVAFGALLAKTGAVSNESLRKALEHTFANKALSIDKLMHAVENGYSFCCEEDLAAKSAVNS